MANAKSKVVKKMSVKSTSKPKLHFQRVPKSKAAIRPAPKAPKSGKH